MDQLTLLTTKNSEGVILSSYSYELNSTGRRESITEQDGRYTNYTYDNLYRLTDETIKQSIDAATADYSANYQYDWVGNRTYETVNGVSTAYTYDSNDRLTQQGGTTYTYDNNGNTLAETLDGITTTYTYDAKNKLTQVDNAGVITTYGYNHAGIRTSKTENGHHTEYLVDTNRAYAQVLSEAVEGVGIVNYSYGHDLISQERAGLTHFYQYDGLGSTRNLTTEEGEISDSYDYEAFGSVINETGHTENNYKFTGEQFDKSLNQYYLRARYYNQTSGRFTQQDTWMGRTNDPITLNKYLYGNADPISYTDPTGNWSLSSLGAITRIQGMLSSMGVSGTSGAITQAVGGALRLGGQATSKIALRALRKCIRKQNKCGLRFNLLIVGYDNSDIKAHIRSVQTASTIVLTYQPRKTGNRRWYATGGGSNGCRLSSKPAGSQCDEFPFFKTREGGAYKTSVSTRWVDASQNMSVGGHFGFLAKNMNDRDKFVVITSDSLPTAALPMVSGKK